MQDYDLQEAVMRLKSAFERASNKQLVDKVGYGISHFRLLKAIAHHSAPTQQAVASELGQSEAAVSRQIKLLIEDGLITIKVNPKNRREHILGITSKGQSKARSAKKIMKVHLHDLLVGLNKKTLAEAVKALNEIASHIQIKEKEE